MNTSHECPPLVPLARRPLSFLSPRQLIVLALLLQLACAGAALAIDHSGTIASNEVWLAADNPHRIVANVTVNAGVTLTLEPGVEVRLDPGLRLQVNGQLDAVGTAGQTILFTRNTTDWGYIYLAGAGSGTFEHCIIEHATYGVYTTSSGSLAATNVVFRQNNYGIYCSGATTIVLTSCEARDSNYGARIQIGSIALASTAFTGNASYGLYCAGVDPTFADALTTFTNNGTGLYIDNVVGPDLTTPLTVTGNTAAGIHLSACDAPDLDNLVLTGNSGTYGALYLVDCGEFTLGAGNVIGGTGLENNWPLSIGAGSYPAAGAVIPTAGNTHDDIQVAGGTGASSGTWRRFTDLDYVVTTNTVFSAGSALTIEPDVTVRLDPSRRLEFRGTLTAVGTAGQEILFTRNGATDWGYLYFANAGAATLGHCIIEHATYGCYATSSGDIDNDHVVYRDNNYGIYENGSGACGFTNCRFQDNNYGIYATGGSVALASTSFSGHANTALRCSGVAPDIEDANVTFEGDATAVYVENAALVDFTTPMTVTGSTTAGIHLSACDAPALDNLVLTGNTGTYGGLYLVDCGEFTLGAGNVIGGTGLENNWPLSIGAGSYPAAGAVIPTSGNTNNDIQVAGGTGASSGTWRKFAGLDYVVTVNTIFNAGSALAIEPDVTVRLDPNRRLEFRGTLTAVGAAGQEILFTGNGATDWGYLYFYGDGGGTLGHCVVERATYGYYCTSTGDVDSDHVVYRDNNYAVYESGSGAHGFTNCQFQDNNYGIFATSGAIALASTAFSGQAATALRCANIAPDIQDANVTFDGNATGVQIVDVAGLQLTTTMTVSDCTTVGVDLERCDGTVIDNLVLTGNVGAGGALRVLDCGDFTLGSGNVIGGAGLENSWPLSIAIGSYPAAASAIPTAGNTNNDIQMIAGLSARTGTLHKFAGLDYVVTGNGEVQAGGVLNVDPGVVFRLAANRYLQFRGTLNAIGTAGQEIVFTQDSASTWNYLYFLGDGAGQLEHCIIEHANYGIYANSSGTIATTAVTLRDNGTGLYAVTGTVSFLHDQIYDNVSYGIRRSGATVVFGSSLGEWNDIYGNGSGAAGRDFHNGDASWIEAKWVYWGTMEHGLILDHIWDLHDDWDLGLVRIMPFVNATHDIPYSAVEDPLPERDLPAVFALSQNAPNPFNPQTVIRFDLPAATPVELKIYDVAGELVRVLIDEVMPAGAHEIVWRGRDRRGRPVPSGIYFYRMTAGSDMAIRRMVLIK